MKIMIGQKKGDISMKTKYFFTSDLHFGHHKDFLYSPRGFTSSEEHDETIIQNWNSVVQNDDVVYVLGDLMLEDNNAGLEKLNRLNGKIYIVWGNHDTDTRKTLYTTCLKSFIGGAFATEIKYGKFNFYLSHYPTITSNYDDDKPCAKHTINLHGHTHDKRKFYNGNPFMYNVALDAHNNYPVEIQEIINDIKKEREMQND